MKRALSLTLFCLVAVPAAPAFADPPPWAPAHGKRAKEGAVYYQPRVLTRRDYVWRGDDGRYRCKRSDGTTGLIVGAAAGALLGRAIDTRGDRATGTILGAAGGALLGKAIDSGELHCK
ncbi:MAG: glycine zipper 2TM domain-containing protein [Sphingobium sp.]